MSYFRFISERDNPGIRLIVFDFDGTLADTKELLLRIVSKHLLSFNISLTKNMIKFFGNVPTESYISLAGVPSRMVRDIASNIIQDKIKEYRKIKPCKNLMAVGPINIRKVIVSNNNTAFVEKSLNFLKANFFQGVYGADKFENKVVMINDLCKKYKLYPSEVVYVGDKDVDVDVARAVGCYSVIIAGKSAWSTRADILKKKPDYALTDLGKLPGVITQLNVEQLPAV